jgi:DNA (cytosine-5)-methyltransferase 1
VSGNPPPRRQAGALAPTLLASGAGTNRPAGIGSEAEFLIPVTQALTARLGTAGADDNQAQGGFLIPAAARAVSVSRGSYPTTHEDLAPAITGRRGDPGSVAYTLLGHGRRNDGESETFIPVAFDLTQITSAANRSRVAPELPAPTLHTGGGAYVIVAASDDDASEDVAGVPAVAHTLSAEGADASEDGTGRGIPLAAMALTSSGQQVDSSDTNHGPPNLIEEYLAVRKLLPIECERLQGFPDRWTCGVLEGDAPISDSARYRMLGNAVAVPVARWIFERLARAGVEPTS